MDAIINYNEAASFLINPPSLEPRPVFANICTLHKYVIKALSQLFCPQNAIHGWLGLVIDPTTYLCLEVTVIVLLMDPGAMAVYLQWDPPTTVKMIDTTFLHNKNYFLLYKNIARACFRMFDINIATKFKVSNTPTLMGWNLTMSFNKILNQLQDSYGKPNMMTLFNNDTLFWSPMAPTDLPKMLFYCIEQCQEIQRTGKLPYFDEQIIMNAICIHVQANIFPLKEFGTWEVAATKRYPALKTLSTRHMGSASQQWPFAARQGKMGTHHKPSTM
jgi:hypothetical protein